MNFKEWKKCSNKKLAAVKMTQTKTGLTETQAKLVDLIDFDRLEGRWIDNLEGSLIYQPTIFEAIFIFDITFVATDKVSFTGADQYGNIFLNEKLLANSMMSEKFVRWELSAASISGCIQTAREATRKEEAIF